MERCMLIFFGSVDYDVLAAEHPGTCALWFVSFTILMAMIMLNMTLAIIFDVYGARKSQAGVSETIWTQLGESTASRVSAKGRVTDQELLDLMERLPTEMIGKHKLLEACPRLSEE